VGMDLDGAGGYFRWNNSGWADVLELGETFGWMPAGPGPPRGVLKAEWEGGSYYGNDGQRFYARDARALADALEQALAVISAGKSPMRSRAARATDYLEAKLGGRAAPRGGKVTVRKYTPEDISNLRAFIEFCRAGSFRIN
jgi:hypothetical protein